MNYKFLKDKMDKFFKRTNIAEVLIEDFEKLGYTFESTDRINNCTACVMIKNGVKSRKTLPHTCGK